MPTSTLADVLGLDGNLDEGTGEVNLAAGVWVALYEDRGLVENRQWVGASEDAQQTQHRNDGLPGTPIAIRNFTTYAEDAEQRFTHLYGTFEQACTRAREKAGELLAAGGNPMHAELTLTMAADEDVLNMLATVRCVLRAKHEPTPAGFIQGVNEANTLMQTPPAEDDIGNIYTPLAPQEKICPWCAETIKAAAIVCRFCGRDLASQH